MAALTLTGDFTALSINGDATPVTLRFSSIRSISGSPVEGSGRLDNGSVLGLLTRILATDALYIQLHAAYLAQTSESFTIDESDGSTSAFTGTIASWDAGIPGQVSFKLRITSSITRG